jgi:ArsR family transcriptional regulator, lead/cadmium/zinc/bismuth-responsive transcriptional repressor
MFKNNAATISGRFELDAHKNMGYSYYINVCLYIETMSHYQPSPSITVLTADDAIRLAEIFTALADPTRLRILSCLMNGRRSVGEVCEAVGMSQPAVSHHLRLLRVGRVVRAEKEGKRVFYCIDDEHIRGLLERALEHISHA